MSGVKKIVAISFIFLSGVLLIGPHSKKSGWRQIDDKIYYFNEDNQKQTGWLVLETGTYFLDDKGALVLNDQEVKVNSKGELVLKNEENITLNNDNSSLNKGVSSSEKAINENENWWVNLSDEQLKKTLIDSLVWLNEVENEYYYGIENLSYGWNEEHQYFGGLVLQENPYHIEFSIPFEKYTLTTLQDVKMWWNAPDYSMQVIFDDLKIDQGKTLTFEQRVSLWESMI